MNDPADTTDSQDDPDTDLGEAIQAPFFWVGIGSSAGGLEALRGFVQNLPNDLPATYIIAQHMAPHYRSMLVEIISRDTSLAVREVEDGVSPEANTIYITPPNSNCRADGDILRLTEPIDGVTKPKPSVDTLLSSLAESRGDLAIGIIFSGTGSDGAEGIMAVHERGGITIAQDEDTAKYSSMPVAAMRTGCVDLVLSPEEVGARFRDLLAIPRNLDALRAAPVQIDAVSQLVQLLFEETKVSFRHYKSATFQRRVERRMAAVNVHRIEEYVGFAKGSAFEVRELFRDLLISVTSFFRDPDEFLTIQPYVQQLVDLKDGEPIRIWVAGTATGEEAYSLAILFAEALGGLNAIERSRLQIFATDLDEAALEIGRRAIYEETALAEVPQEYIDQYFEDTGEGYRIKKGIRDRVIFSTHDVTADPPFLRLDFMSCRNLLIYFENVLQLHVLSRFRYAMRDHGVLFLGKSETAAAGHNLFRQAGSDKHIFLTSDGANGGVPDVITPTRAAPALSQPTAKFPPPEARELTIYKARFETLIASLGPNAILVSPDLKILRVYGDISKHVKISEGTISADAGSILAEPFRQDVRVLVPSAIRKGEAVRGIVRSDDSDPEQRQQLIAHPIGDGLAGDSLALVVFSTWVDERPAVLVDEFDEASSEVVAYLRSELATAQDNLQQTIEIVETSNEELQALNEELQSTNEELQSTNEELETSNEELQSTNEELTTVNDELEVNSAMLGVANQNLQSILENAGVPMVVVDADLNVTHTSTAAHDLFSIRPELRHPHLSRCALPAGYPNMVELVEQALESDEHIEMLIEAGPTSSNLSIVPHVGSSGTVHGAIIVVSDSTAALHASNFLLTKAANVAQIGYIWTDVRTRITRWSPYVYTLVGEEEGSYVPSDLNAMGADFIVDENREELRERFRGLMRDKSDFDFESEIVDRHGDTKTLRLDVSPTIEDGNVVGWVGIALDITDQKRREQAMAKAVDGLSAQNELLRAAEQTSGTAYAWADLVNDTNTWSENMFTIYGMANDGSYVPFPPSQWVRGGLGKFLSESEEERLLANVERLKNKAIPFGMELEITADDGGEKTLRLQMSPKVDVYGKVVGWLVVSADITSQVQRENELNDTVRELEHANAMLRASAHIAGFPYIVCDISQDQSFWSKEMYRLLGLDNEAGYAPIPPSAWDLDRFLRSPQSGELRAKIANVVNTGEPFEMDIDFTDADGEVKATSLRVTATTDDGGGRDGAITGWVAVATERATTSAGS